MAEAQRVRALNPIAVHFTPRAITASSDSAQSGLKAVSFPSNTMYPSSSFVPMASSALNMAKPPIDNMFRRPVLFTPASKSEEQQAIASASMTMQLVMAGVPENAYQVPQQAKTSEHCQDRNEIPQSPLVEPITKSMIGLKVDTDSVKIPGSDKSSTTVDSMGSDTEFMLRIVPAQSNVGRSGALIFDAVDAPATTAPVASHVLSTAPKVSLTFSSGAKGLRGLVRDPDLPPHLWRRSSNTSQEHLNINRTETKVQHNALSSPTGVRSHIKDSTKPPHVWLREPQEKEKEAESPKSASTSESTARFRYTSTFKPDGDGNMVEDEASKDEKMVMAVKESPDAGWSSSQGKKEHNRPSVRIVPDVPGCGGWTSNKVRQNLSLRDGHIIGQDAQPLSMESKGRKMMAIMGWQAGQGLGVNMQGLVNHVEAVVKIGTAGLGASTMQQKQTIPDLQLDPGWPTSDNTATDLCKLPMTSIGVDSGLTLGEAVQQPWDKTTPENLARGERLMRRSAAADEKREKEKMDRAAQLSKGVYKAKKHKRPASGSRVRFLKEGTQPDDEEPTIRFLTRIQYDRGYDTKKTHHHPGTVVEASEHQSMMVPLGPNYLLRFEKGDELELLQTLSNKYILAGNRRTGKVGPVEILCAQMDASQIMPQKNLTPKVFLTTLDWLKDGDMPKEQKLVTKDSALVEFSKFMEISGTGVEVSFGGSEIELQAVDEVLFSSFEEALKHLGPGIEPIW